MDVLALLFFRGVLLDSGCKQQQVSRKYSGRPMGSCDLALRIVFFLGGGGVDLFGTPP